MSDDSDADHRSIRFTHIKSSSFRVAHVDGAIGGWTPRGKLAFSLYSERAAIPQVIQHVIQADGTLGDIEAFEGKEGIVREIEIGLVMDPNVAREFHQWLTDRLSDYDKLLRLKNGN